MMGFCEALEKLTAQQSKAKNDEIEKKLSSER